MLFIITQQVQPAFCMFIMQSQQAWIMAQQAASPLVQVMHTPSGLWKRPGPRSSSECSPLR